MTDKKKENQSINKEDNSLWHRFCQTITAYCPAQSLMHDKGLGERKAVSHTKKTHLSSHKVVDTPMLFPNSSLDKNLLKKMRAGDIVIHTKLDLHGMTEHQAHLAFNEFITISKENGKRNLLVITGKGKTFQSTGVLKASLSRWIAMPDIMPSILAYCHAAPKDGGSGAWYIILRKNKK